MDLSAASLLASLLVGTAGFAIFVYGKKQVRVPQIVAGLVLMVYPYFVASAAIIWGIAGAVTLGLWLAVRAGW